MASKASAIATTREPSGIVLARERIGVAAAVPPLVARPHELCDILERGGGEQDALSDDRVTADELPLLVAERARLAQDRVGDPDLADVVQLCGEAEALTSSVSSPRTVAVASTSCATPSACASRSGWRSARAWSRTFLDCDSTGARRECFCAYIRWSVEQRLGGLRGLAGSVTAPYEQPMWKPSPCSVNAAAAPRMIGSATWGPGRKSTQNSSPPMR